ncbi:immunity 49 family protein [Tamlana agarivorans]|uniref:Immunity 49 family protein n=1 Tax=Pseudotamlana agarivorans TaxID=481183 RepID=A0ACC5U9B5_9FLAO|nr:immunity 49 family protein [Tamlana agarivorans]MBU2950785.1 immunity 49 family protein [Tamlana agarivorans]
MDDLIDRIKRFDKRKSKWINNILNDKNNTLKMSSNFHFLELNLAIYKLLDKKINESKQHFYIVSIIDKIRVSEFNNRLFDFGLPYVCFPILSDNENLIQQYSKLRYQKGKNAELSMDEMVLQGESAVWCNTVQFFMANDFKGVERNLNIIETLTLPKLPKNQQEFKIDYEFYKALLNKDKSKCEELLEQLVSTKIHKKRNDNAVLNKYVSQPALGYAKLAWRQSLEVEVNSPLIPKEILPIEPLDNYEIPYDFLKDELF